MAKMLWCTMTNDDAHEQGYIEGRNRAYRHALLYLARELGIFSKEDPSVQLAHAIDERARAIKALRAICEKLGCNDWPDNLDLGDVVEKHILPAIDDAKYSELRPGESQIVVDLNAEGSLGHQAITKERYAYFRDVERDRDELRDRLAKLEAACAEGVNLRDEAAEDPTSTIKPFASKARS